MNLPKESYENYQTYAAFEQFELRSRDIIALFGHFREDAALSALWWSMSLDETDHYMLLRFCRERGLLEPIQVSSEQMNRIDLTLRTSEATVNEPNLPLREAFRIAIGLETSELNTIFRMLTHPFESPLYRVAYRFNSSLTGHLSRLSEAARNYFPGDEMLQRLEDLEDRL